MSDRVLYDILIQAGRVVDLYIPRDKETERPKGFAFAEYETEEIADYAVRLFSGLVTLYNRTLKFAVRLYDLLCFQLVEIHTSLEHRCLLVMQTLARNKGLDFFTGLLISVLVEVTYFYFLLFTFFFLSMNSFLMLD